MGILGSVATRKRTMPADKKRKVISGEGGGAPRRAGMLGCGTVGGAVFDVLKEQEQLLLSQGCNVKIVKVCVRDASKKRACLPADCEIVTDYHAITADPEIDMVIEVMGGTTDAKDAVFEALNNGKDVITANKALLAEHLPAILELVEAKDVTMGYEAAVCGGIPIIQTLQNALFADSVTGIKGIMNGTTNYMLSKMESEGMEYDAVLKEAQDLGFAEADPTADVDGLDVRAKIALLTKLAIGVYVDPEKVPTVGIRRVAKFDFEYASYLNSTIKLLGQAKVQANGELSIMVAPTLVNKSNPIASISGPTNIAAITSKNLGESYYVGPGAGGAATANSVVSDLVFACRGGCSTPFPKTKDMKVATDYSSKFYIRFLVTDCVGIIADIAGECAKNGVSIDAIHQMPLEQNGWKKERCPFAMMTDECTFSQVQSAATALSSKKWALEEPFIMPCI